MTLKGFRKFLLPLPIVSVLSLASLSAYAASVCKGLDESACRQSPPCGWVSGYTTKNGNTVSAYCRSRGRKANQGLHQKEGKGTQSGAEDRTTQGASNIVRKSEETNG